MEKIQQRLDYLDIAKAIGILFVIVGHVAGNLDTPFYRVVLYYFHMPLFFMTTGLLISRKEIEFNKEYIKNFIYKNLYALMLPFLLWGLIYSTFNYTNLLKILYGSWESLTSANTLTSLWYLPALFCARLEMEFFLQFTKKIPLPLWLLDILGAIAVFAAAVNLPKFEIGYLWCFDVSLLGFGFMLIGNAVRQIVHLLNANKIAYSFMILAASLVAFYFGTFARASEVELVLLCSKQLGNLNYLFLNAISGSFAVIAFSLIISRMFKNHQENRVYKRILWIGSNTIAVFLLHKPFLQQVVLWDFKAIGLTGPEWLTAIYASIFALLVCCVIIKPIDNCIPQLFGRRPKNN